MVDPNFKIDLYQSWSSNKSVGIRSSAVARNVLFVTFTSILSSRTSTKAKWLMHQRACRAFTTHARTRYSQKIDQLLNSILIRYWCNLFEREVYVDFLDNELECCCTQSQRIPIYRAQINPLVEALHSNSMLDQKNSSLKYREHRCHYEHNTIPVHPLR